jgi:hypothetical protein
VDEFLDAVTKHRNFVVGKEKSLAGKSLMGALIAPRYIQYLLPSLAIHYEQNMPRLQRFILRMKSSKKWGILLCLASMEWKRKMLPKFVNSAKKAIMSEISRCSMTPGIFFLSEYIVPNWPDVGPSLFFSALIPDQNNYPFTICSLHYQRQWHVWRFHHPSACPDHAIYSDLRGAGYRIIPENYREYTGSLYIQGMQRTDRMGGQQGRKFSLWGSL